MALLIRTAVLLSFLILPPPATADEGLSLAEQDIKAGLIYNFLKYTDWPENTAQNTTQMQVCVFGNSPFAANLQPMQGRSVNRREIVVRNIRTVAEVNSCELLFISDGEKENWPELRTALHAKSILTVSDFEGFRQGGGMVEFSRANNRIHVELNLPAISEAHLKIKDRLLHLVALASAGER